LTEPRDFNGMFKTYVGPVQETDIDIVVVINKQIVYNKNKIEIPEIIINVPSEFDYEPADMYVYDCSISVNDLGSMQLDRTNYSVKDNGRKEFTLNPMNIDVKVNCGINKIGIKFVKYSIGGIFPQVRVVEFEVNNGMLSQIIKLKPQSDSNLAYLRPETAQGIFANFLNVLQSMRRKLPFGIAQIGKAFRNEITPGNFTFRTREFEQMEIEYFCKPPQYLQPGEKTDEQLHQEWVEARYNWYIGLGMSPERLKKRPQAPEELAHYAKACVDLEYLFPGSLGWSELEGVANRQDYDLTAHSNNVNDSDLQRLKLARNEHSTEKMEYFDEAYADPATGKKGAKYIPFVIEPSAGADRATLAFLCEAYNEEQLSQPSDESLSPLKEAAAAALKSIGKKIAEAQKKPGSDAPTLEQLQAIEKSLQAAIEKLPDSLLAADAACSLPGADRIELLKKVRLTVGKLCDEHTRAVLKLHPELAPIKVAVLPLKKNEPGIVETAKRIKTMLQSTLCTIYDDTAGIGKLYRRQDEIGTPFCVTVDFQTLQDQTVTLRDRDSMGQERHKIEELAGIIAQKMVGWNARQV
jgi:glycyl-tRNA synthetase